MCRHTSRLTHTYVGNVSQCRNSHVGKHMPMGRKGQETKWRIWNMCRTRCGLDTSCLQHVRSTTCHSSRLSSTTCLPCLLYIMSVLYNLSRVSAPVSPLTSTSHQRGGGEGGGRRGNRAEQRASISSTKIEEGA